MTTNNPSAPAASLFPEYGTLPGMFAREAEGLSEETVRRRRPEKGWGGWSIYEQVSHTAWIPYLFFLRMWRPILFPGGAPRDERLADTGGADRMLDPARFPGLADALAAMEDSFALAREVLARETVGSLREKTKSRRVTPDLAWASGERVIDYYEKLVLPAHKIGFWRDADDPELFHQTLECSLRHIVWEAWVHLKTIQKHKEAEGLPPLAAVPEVGFIPLLTWG